MARRYCRTGPSQCIPRPSAMPTRPAVKSLDAVSALFVTEEDAALADIAASSAFRA